MQKCRPYILYIFPYHKLYAKKITFYSPKINLPNLFLLKISMISVETPSVNTILAPTIIQGFLIFRTLIINVLEITSKKPLNKYNCKERCPHFCKTLPIGELFKQPTLEPQREFPPQLQSETSTQLLLSSVPKPQFLSIEYQIEWQRLFFYSQAFHINTCMIANTF